MGVCIKRDGQAVSVQFDTTKPWWMNGASGGAVKKSMRIPLLAAISHPTSPSRRLHIRVQADHQPDGRDTSSTRASGSFEAKLEAGHSVCRSKGAASPASTQTHQTDTPHALRHQHQDRPPRIRNPCVSTSLTDAARKPNCGCRTLNRPTRTELPTADTLAMPGAMTRENRHRRFSPTAPSPQQPAAFTAGHLNHQTGSVIHGVFFFPGGSPCVDPATTGHITRGMHQAAAIPGWSPSGTSELFDQFFICVTAWAPIEGAERWSRWRSTNHRVYR
jgi:hypothetical protein